MPWFKIDDGFHSHPKVLAAGNAALGLWTRCGAYSSDHLLDGFIPAALANTYGTRTEIGRLVAAGLWHPTEGGYLMHDFHEYNPTAEQVRADRAAAAERQRRARERRQSNGQQSHDTSHVTEGESRRDFAFPDPTRPDPTPLVTSAETKHHPSRDVDSPVDIDAWAERRRA